jgi:hypothetical protein
VEKLGFKSTDPKPATKLLQNKEHSSPKLSWRQETDHHGDFSDVQGLVEATNHQTHMGVSATEMDRHGFAF